MSTTLERIRSEALDLSETERKELVHDLIDSLSWQPDAAVEAAWDAEIRRRLKDQPDGTWKSHEEVMAEARRRSGATDN